MARERPWSSGRQTSGSTTSSRSASSRPLARGPFEPALELHLGPSTDVRALGAWGSLGYAVRSFGTLQLQGGFLSVRREGVEAGLIRETYSGLKGFIGVSISGWAPFLPG